MRRPDSVTGHGDDRVAALEELASSGVMGPAALLDEGSLQGVVTEEQEKLIVVIWHRGYAGLLGRSQRSEPGSPGHPRPRVRAWADPGATLRREPGAILSGRGLRTRLGGSVCGLRSWTRPWQLPGRLLRRAIALSAALAAWRGCQRRDEKRESGQAGGTATPTRARNGRSRHRLSFYRSECGQASCPSLVKGAECNDHVKLSPKPQQRCISLKFQA